MDISPPLPPPPPPPSSSQIFHFPPVHSSGGNSFPVLAIALIGILATAFLLVSYYIFVIKCCLNWHRVDVLNSFFSRRRNPNDEIVSSATNTSSPNGNSPVQKGLDEAIIRSIPVIKFRKLVERPEFTSSSSNNTNTTMQHDTAATYECAVCLNEFEENERLRVIPNCCHAFHIDCIDVWLQSSANCPLCRSGISPSSVLCNNNHIFSHPQFRNPSSSKSSSSNSSDEDEGYVVIEIRNNNLDEPMLVHTQPQPQPQPRAVEEEMKECKKVKKLGHVCSMGDELIDSMRKKDDEFQVQSIRRSISMDLSSDREFCHEIQEYCRSTTTSNNMQVSSSSSSSSSASNSNKVRRSIFSFGYGRSSRCSVQPLHLDS